MPAGRPPKPTRLKVLTGNPGKRKLNAREPQPAAGAPSCPSWLSKEAKAEWKRAAQELGRLGLLTVVDRATLTAYCLAWVELYEATKLIQTEGRIVTTDKGSKKPHPAVAMQRSAWAAVRAFSSLFGLDPSSRGKLHVEPPKAEEDEMRAFLGESG
jgi:P27 family predicted phage terminase small subunit